MTEDAGCELHPSELAIKSICPPVVFGAQVYKVLVDSPTDLKGEVECRLVVTHRSGCWWIVRRSFSDLLCLHDILAASFDGVPALTLPPLDTRVISSSTKALPFKFLQQTCLALQEFVHGILGRKDLARHPAVQFILGVVRPEPPAGLRMVASGEEHELEMRPGNVMIAGCTEADAHGAPVDGYFIDITHLETGASYQFTRDVGCGGSQLVRALVQEFKPGPHRIIARSLNLAGPSAPIEVTIDASKVDCSDSLSMSLASPKGMVLPSQPPNAKRLGSTCKDSIDAGQSSPIKAGSVAKPIGGLSASLGSARSLASQPTSTAVLFSQQQGAAIGPMTRDHRDGFAPRAKTLVQKPMKGCEHVSRAENVRAKLTAGSEMSRGIDEALLKNGSKGVLSTTEAAKDDACVICLSDNRTHAFVPCGHRCVCRTCGEALMSQPLCLVACPMCRVGAVKVIHIFM